MNPSKPLTIGDVIDSARLTRFQVTIFVLCALIAVLDGLDSQSIGIVAPLIGKDLHLSPDALGVIFSLSQLGAAAGAMTFGPLGDRFGRKPMILLATALVAVFTYLTAVVTGFYPLLAVRTLAGLGLGGALPLVMALASEYAPSRLRGAVVTMVFAGYPLGGALGGVVNGLILEHFDWRGVFYVGALSPILVFIAAAAVMPDSIPFLLRARPARAHAILRRIDPAADTSAITVAAPVDQRRSASTAALFAGRLALATPMIWGLYFFAYATLKVMTTWFPSILKQAGLTVSQGGYALGAFNIGATVGMAGAGYLTDRFGPFRALIPALAGGAVCVFLLGASPANVGLVMALATLIGLFIGIGGSGAHAIATRLYASEVRSTGLGLGVAASRLGQVLSPMLVAWMLTAGLGPQSIYAATALLPLIAAAFVLGLVLQERAASVTRPVARSGPPGAPRRFPPPGDPSSAPGDPR